MSEYAIVDKDAIDRLNKFANTILTDKTKNTLSDWIADYGAVVTDEGRVSFGSHYALHRMLMRRDKDVIRHALSELGIYQPKED